MMGFFCITCSVDDLLRTTESRGNWKTTHTSPDTTQTIEKTSTHTEIPITSTTTIPTTSQSPLSTYTTKIVTDTNQSSGNISTKTTPKHTQSTPPNETHNIFLSPEQT